MHHTQIHKNLAFHYLEPLTMHRHSGKQGPIHSTTNYNLSVTYRAEKVFTRMQGNQTLSNNFLS